MVRLVSTVMNELKRARERKEGRKRDKEKWRSKEEERRGVKKKITANKNARREKKK